VKKPGNDEGKYHASKQEIEETVSLPKAPGFTWLSGGSDVAACFV